MKPNAIPLILLSFLCLMAPAATAQAPPLTLRQAIDQALNQNPQAAIAHAGEQDASAAAALSRTALLPQLVFLGHLGGNNPFMFLASGSASGNSRRLISH